MRLQLVPPLGALACWLTSSTAVASDFRTRAAIAFQQQQHPYSHIRGNRRLRRRRLLTRSAGGTFGCSSSSSWAALQSTPPRVHHSSSSSTKKPSAPSAQLKYKNVEELLDAHCGPNDTLLIVFTALHCGPCKLQKHELATFQQKLGQRSPTTASAAAAAVATAPIKLLAIDADKWPGVGKRFAVAKLPCVILVRNKQVVARLEGLTTADTLVERVLHLRGIVRPTTEEEENEDNGPEAKQPRED